MPDDQDPVETKENNRDQDANSEQLNNLETINKPYNGNMISFKSEGIDISVTPDHKMFAGFRKVEDKKIHLEYKVVRADSLLGKSNFHLRKNAI